MYRRDIGERATAHSGTNYPIREEQLQVLQNEHLGPGDIGWRPFPQRALNIEEATAGFVRYIKNDQYCHSWTREEFGGANRRRKELLEYQGARRSNDWEADIIFKIFDDLDICFFNMELCRRVHLRWKAYPRGGNVYAKTEPPSEKCNRVQITLYYKVIRKDNHSFFFLLEKLLHEMLHAYLLIMTAGEDYEYNMSAQPRAHGPCFAKCANILTKIHKGKVNILQRLDEIEGHYPSPSHVGGASHSGPMFGQTPQPQGYHSLGSMRMGGRRVPPLLPL